MNQQRMCLPEPDFRDATGRACSIHRRFPTGSLWTVGALALLCILALTEKPAWGEDRFQPGDARVSTSSAHCPAAADDIDRATRRKTATIGFFILASAWEIGGIGLLLLLSFMSTGYGLRLILRSGTIAALPYGGIHAGPVRSSAPGPG